MNVHPLIIVSSYFLIGIFIASVIMHASDDDDPTMFTLYAIFWPIVLCGLLTFVVLAIPYVLGKFIGRFIQDLVGAIR